MAGKYKTYTPEFREEVAKMVIQTSRGITEVAREYGVNDTTVGNWVRAYRQKHGEAGQPLDLPERARMREMGRKIRELEMKCAFLTKAAAYFAAEHR
jgi:transposase-like protein